MDLRETKRFALKAQICLKFHISKLIRSNNKSKKDKK